MWVWNRLDLDTPEISCGCDTLLRLYRSSGKHWLKREGGGGNSVSCIRSGLPLKSWILMPSMDKVKKIIIGCISEPKSVLLGSFFFYHGSWWRKRGWNSLYGHFTGRARASFIRLHCCTGRVSLKKSVFGCEGKIALFSFLKNPALCKQWMQFVFPGEQGVSQVCLLMNVLWTRPSSMLDVHIVWYWKMERSQL